MPVRVALEGPADAPVVMLAHGIMTTHRVWDAFAARLSSNWRVLRYDLRGHGGTAVTPAPYTIEQLAGDALGLLDALEICSAHFIGTSLGGMIGQWLGAWHGERLQSLTLANTTAVQVAPAAWAQRIETARREGLAPLVEATLERWFTPEFVRGGREPMDRMRALAQATPAEGFIGCAAAVRDLAQADLLARIRTRTLVIAGEHDTATPPTEAQQIVKHVSGAMVVSLPAAHQAAFECPEEFFQCWSRWVNQRGL